MRVLFAVYLSLLSYVAISGPTPADGLDALESHPEQDTVRVNILNSLSNRYRWFDFVVSRQYAEEALRISGQLLYYKGMAEANTRLAHCYWALGDNDLSIGHGLAAASMAEARRFNSVLGESFQVLARAYMDQRETQKAEYYIGRAEAIALREKNWDLLSRVYNLAGVIEFVKDNRDSALLLYTRARDIVEDHGTSRVQLSQITSNIGECYLRKDPDKAFKYLHAALLIAKSEKTRNRSAEAAISNIIGHALVRKGSYAEAEKYLDDALQLARGMGLKRSIRYAYSGLVDLKISQGKTAEALEYLTKYYEVHDSILNVAKTRQIVELETKHELEKKELALLLQAKDNRIRMLWRNILISMLVVLSAGALTFYFVQLDRGRKNRRIFNLQIDKLTAQHKELSEKFKDSLSADADLTIASVDQRLLKQAIDVIENNIGNSSFGVEQMSRDLGMSRTHMHRKLKSITGFPPSELIRSIRMKKAASLLLSQADSVSQISYKVGFEDHSYFTKAFKKQFSVTPSEYLASMKAS